MPDGEILSELIREGAIISLQHHYDGKWMVELEEPSVQDSKVKINNIPADTIVIRLNVLTAISAMFRSKKGECKCADFVIISPEKKCILYIEMKRTIDKWDSIVQQLTGAMCFVEYCRILGREFWNEKNFLTDYKKRFISIRHTSISKKSTRPNQVVGGGSYDTPSTAMKINHPRNLQFKMLSGS